MSVSHYIITSHGEEGHRLQLILARYATAIIMLRAATIMQHLILSLIILAQEVVEYVSTVKIIQAMMLCFHLIIIISCRG